MRNTITIFDGDKPRPMFKDLEVGEMFRYPIAHNPQNIYMRIDTTFGAVLLNNGANYPIQKDKEVERIASIRITRC